MDARLRILERQARASGVVADWERYAQGLRRALGDEDVNGVNLWVVIEQNPQDLFRISVALHTTEVEAKGEIVKGYLDFAKQHISAMLSDETPEWGEFYTKFVALVEASKYEEAWEYYHGEELDSTLFEGIIDLLPMYGLEQLPLI